jgi:hypothetical protein
MGRFYPERSRRLPPDDEPQTNNRRDEALVGTARVEPLPVVR